MCWLLPLILSIVLLSVVNLQSAPTILKEIKFPFSLTVACDSRLIVCDLGDNSVKVLSPDGTELLQSFRIPDCDESPWEAVSHQDKFFVSYPTAGCVKTFNKDGDFLYDIGDELAGEGQLSKPRGLVDLVLIPITTWRFVTRKTKR